MRKDTLKEVRVNRQIRAKEVRVIGEGGEQLGVMPVPKALQLADEHNLDLVEVAPSSVPPVCRLLDYGRYRYDMTKKQRKARQGQKTGMLKEIRVRPRVQEHDLETKIKAARKNWKGFIRAVLATGANLSRCLQRLRSSFSAV